MRFSDAIDRLTATTTDNWAVYRRAREMISNGHDIVELAIGEPDIAAPDDLIDATIHSLRAGRTNYSSGRGELALRDALAARYTERLCRGVTTDQILWFPGTQTALYAAVRAVAGPGDDLLVGDPMYATYAPVAAAAGARVVPVPLRPERGFRIAAADIADRITPTTRAILLNTPHNPTGAILSAADIEAIGRVACDHDVWLLVDEVYEELVYRGREFVSPLAHAEFAERVVVVNSISKSYAAPGYRSGWLVASREFCDAVLPLSEAMLFGGQPFLADATAAVVRHRSQVAAGMVERFAARAARLADQLHADTALRVHVPDAGMFALVDVSSTGMDGSAFADDLLTRAGVAVMPGASFGTSITDWVRVALTRPDEVFDEGCRRLAAHAIERSVG